MEHNLLEALPPQSPGDENPPGLGCSITRLAGALGFQFESSCQTKLCLIAFQAVLCPLVVLAQPDWH